MKILEEEPFLCYLAPLFSGSEVIVNSSLKLIDINYLLKPIQRSQNNYFFPELKKIPQFFNPLSSYNASMFFHTSGIFCIDPVPWPGFLTFKLLLYKHKHFCYTVNVYEFFYTTYHIVILND